MEIDLDEMLRLIENSKTVRSRKLIAGDYKTISLEGMRADNIVIEDSDFSGSNLNRVSIRNSLFRRICCDQILIKNSVIRLSDFDRVFLKEADFSDSCLENTNASGCDFEKAIFINSSIVDSNFNRSNFRGASLTNVDASFCNMRGADFRGAKLIKTKFRDADLRGADFTGAHLEEVDFRGANVEGALFDKSFNEIPDRDETDMLAAIVDPVARNIIKTATEKKLFNEKQAAAELDSVLKSLFGVDKTKNCEAGLNIEIENVMASVAGAGIGPLIDALQQQEGEPPEAVKKLIEDLIKRGNFPENTTTEDLLSSLLGVVGKK